MAELSGIEPTIVSVQLSYYQFCIMILLNYFCCCWCWWWWWCWGFPTVEFWWIVLPILKYRPSFVLPSNNSKVLLNIFVEFSALSCNVYFSFVLHMYILVHKWSRRWRWTQRCLCLHVLMVKVGLKLSLWIESMYTLFSSSVYHIQRSTRFYFFRFVINSLSLFWCVLLNDAYFSLSFVKILKMFLPRDAL